MSNNSNWKSVLKKVLDEHNFTRSRRNKVVSHRTAEARIKGLFYLFSLLRRMGYHIDPRHLRNMHIRRIVEYMTASPAIAKLCAERGIPMPTKPYSAAYIQQQLSFLRVFSTWIGKPGMVLNAERYVDDPGLVRRTYSAQEDKGWETHGHDIAALIEKVAQIDERVAAQLNLMWQFGLRRKEAVMFRPHVAVVPVHAVPASHHASDRYVAFLKIKRGTKGGRLRYTAIRTEEQKRAIEQACRFAFSQTSHMGHPGLDLKQSLKRFDNMIRKAGITRKTLGATAHGLRHQFAGDLFFDVTNIKAPVRGGELSIDSATMKAAYLEVAQQLGHARPQISNAYLGSPVRSARKAALLAEGKA